MISNTRLRSGIMTYRGETERVDLYTKCGNVFLFEFTSKMALDEGGL